LLCASTSACKATCTADSDCITGDYCASGACTAKLANGAKCGATNQCKNGNCVEGVCCDGACGQTCRSCLGSKTGGQDGTCANMNAGTPCATGVCSSTATCVACVQGGSCTPTNVCKTGKLDCSTGAPVCNPDQNLDSTHACGPAASCNTTTNKATRAQTCDGLGSCPAAIVDTCAYGCNGTVCATAKPQGTVCASTAECATGLSCADGYCCNNTCTASCQACNVAGSLGACTTLVSGEAPHAGHTACSGSSPCKGSCNGSSSSCTYPGAETTCVQASCTGQTQALAASCAGNGTCTPATTKPCNGYGCNGAVCAAGTNQGGSCSTTAQCAAGLYCTDGVCCTTQTSCGTCHACNRPGSLGVCSAVAQGTSDSACPADSSNCMYGGCNSSGACQASPSGTACGGGTVCTDDPSITAGQRASTSLLRNKKCNGTTAGAAGCLVDNVSTPTTCGAPQGAPGLTCQNAASCKTSCFVESDCSQYFYCNAGACTPKNGATCANATQCTNGACSGSFVNPTPTCKVCISDYTCPIEAPNCQLAVGVPGCVACNTAAQSCNADGSVYCPTQTCPSNAPDCGSDHHCHCGTGAQCPNAGQICVSGQCKMAGQWPCINSGDCAYGTCTGGVCPQSSSGQLCTGVLDSECSTGYCNYSNKCP
jgi:hypothetical protein